MANILCIETATTNCSVSITTERTILALKEENTASYSHSEQLHVFIGEALKEAELAFDGLDAIAVSMGPGSYTGLRIGVSAAKGLCFALDVPLIAVSTLESMARQIAVGDEEAALALLDARRMEVYSAAFNSSYEQIGITKAEIVDEHSFQQLSDYKKVYVIGNGAEKCKGVLNLKNAEYKVEVFPSAKEMGTIALEKYKKGDFKDVAYFEPFYLKDFIVGGKKN